MMTYRMQIWLLGIAGVSSALASCAYSEAEGIETPPAGGIEIGFRTTALSRGAVDEFEAGSAFAVWGWYVPEDAASEVFAGTRVSTADGLTWVYEGLRYWNVDKTYSFGALFPSLDTLAGVADEVFWSREGILTVKGFDASQGVDLMASSTVDVAGSTGMAVPLTFHHLLARVQLVARRSEATAGIADFNPVVTEAKLYGMPCRGDLSMAASSLGDLDATMASWSVPADGGDVTGSDSPMAVTAGSRDVSREGVVLLDVLLPAQVVQADYVVEMTYKAHADRESRTASIQLTSLPVERWDAGRQYRYAFAISDDERILFEVPTVNEWSEAIGGVNIVE